MSVEKDLKLMVLTSQNINALNGSARFVKLFEQYAEEFNKQGVVIRIVSNSGSFSDEAVYRNTPQYRRKEKIKRWLGRTKAGSCLLIYLTLIRNGKNAVRRIEPEQLKDSTVILNDIFAAYYFFKRYPADARTFFMMHNSGDAVKMVLDRYPRAKIKPLIRFFDKMQNRIMDKANCIIFVSETARRTYQKKFPRYSQKTRYIAIGQPDVSTPCRGSDRTMNLITVGSICPRKNQIMVIECIKEIGDPSVQLTLIGDGEQLEECREYVKRNHMENQVHLPGARKDVSRYLATSDLFILASKDEGLPIAAQEALRAGLPLILTDVGGCRECINGNGLLVRPDMEEIKRAILYMRDHREMWKTFSENSRRLYEENYSVEVMIRKYCALVRSGA